MRICTTRNEQRRYVVALPSRSEFWTSLNLWFSRRIALSQFIRNEARLLKSPEAKSQSDSVIDKYCTLGHMTRVSADLAHSPNSNYYLLHHAVFKLDSTTTKLRVDFNASSSSSNGVSLNNVLHPGPILQSNLTILIMRWRRLFRYVFNSDIEKMCKQMLIRSDQGHFQRILFRRRLRIGNSDVRSKLCPLFGD